MKYLNGRSFSVQMGGDRAFSENWDRIFDKKPEKPDRVVYPAPCVSCTKTVEARDSHWALGVQVRCGTCGPFSVP